MSAGLFNGYQTGTFDYENCLERISGYSLVKQSIEGKIRLLHSV